MNVTVTMQPAEQVNRTATVWFAVLAGLTVIVDISYFIVCFKALKKTFHHLMILGLFFSDSILGISSALFSLSSLIKHEFIGSCLVQFFLFLFGIQLNYLLIFMLCLQRYFAVKSFNFGTNERFDRNKFKHIGVAIVLTFSTSICALLTPKVEYVQVCTGSAVFGDSFYIFATIISLPIAVIIFSILILSIITSFRLWKIYFKGTIAPIRREDINISYRMQSAVSYTNHCSHSSDRNASDIQIQDEDKEETISLTDIEILNVTSSTEVNGDMSEIRKPCKMNSGQCCNVVSCQHPQIFTMTNYEKHSYNSTTNKDKTKMFQVQKTVQRKSESSSSKKKDFKHEENSNAMVDLKLYRHRNHVTTSTDDSRSFDESRQFKKSWEIRAFVTCIIIAFQTIILTGPFVASLWVEVFSDAPLTQQSEILIFMPYLINSISNPFIYAWRIPGIRHEFRKLFRKNN